MSSSAGAPPRLPTGCGAKADVSGGTSARGGEPVPPAGAGGESVPRPGRVAPPAEELHGVGDDLDRLALVAVLARPLAPLEAPVDGDRPALAEEPGAVLALRAPHGHAEVVGLVDPLAARVVLAPRVRRDPQAADGHAGRGGAELRVARQVPREDDAVDVRCRHVGWLLSNGDLAFGLRPSLRAGAAGSSTYAGASAESLRFWRRARERRCNRPPRRGPLPCSVRRR